MYMSDWVQMQPIQQAKITWAYFVLNLKTEQKRHYSTGVQIVSCTLSSDSVLADSTGLFNPVLSVSANEIAFDKKIANQSVSFNWC